MSGAEVFAVVGFTASLIECIRTARETLRSLEPLRSTGNQCDDRAIQLNSLIGLLQRVERHIKTSPSSCNADAEWHGDMLRELEGCNRHVKRLKALADSVAAKSKDTRLTRWTKTAKSLTKHKELVKCYTAIGTYRASITNLMTAAVWDNVCTDRRLITNAHGHEQDAGPAFQPVSTTIATRAKFDNLPLLRNEHFFGREKELETLRSCLVSPSMPHPSSSNRIFAIHGMPGIGKTQLALEYARRHRNAYESVLWVNAESKKHILQSYERMAESLHLMKDTTTDQSSCIEPVNSCLSKIPAPWLMVFDDVEDYDEIMQYLPSSPNGQVIITSRKPPGPNLPPHSVIRVEPFTERESKEYLIRRLNVERSEHSLAEAVHLSETLQRLPLPLDLAARYILATDISLGEYQEELDACHERLPSDGKTPPQKETPASPHPARGPVVSYDQPNLDVLWNLALNALVDARPEAPLNEFVRCVACLDSTHVSEAIFRKASKSNVPSSSGRTALLNMFMTNGEWDSDRFESLVTELDSLSLLAKVDHTSDHIGFSLRPMFADWLLREVRPRHIMDAAGLVGDYIQSYTDESLGPLNRLPLRQRQEINAHIDSCLEHLQHIPMALCQQDENAIKVNSFRYQPNEETTNRGTAHQIPLRQLPSATTALRAGGNPLRRSAAVSLSSCHHQTGQRRDRLMLSHIRARLR
jgi:hypothetical protein